MSNEMPNEETLPVVASSYNRYASEELRSVQEAFDAYMRRQQQALALEYYIRQQHVIETVVDTPPFDVGKLPAIPFLTAWAACTVLSLAAIYGLFAPLFK
jgi:hypothetical protein